MKTIGVWNTAFLGDAVLTLPLLQNLRLAFPDAAIDFYVRRGFAGLFSAHPDLRAVYEYDKNGAERGLGAFLRKGGELRGRAYDIWISAHPSLRSAALARLGGAEMRIGYSGAWYSSFYTHAVDRCFDSLDEIERLLRLLRPLGVEARSLAPDLRLPPEALARAEEYFRKNVRGPVLGLHPGSVWGTKRWPAEYFARVAVLAIEAGAQAMLFAGPGEEDMAREVAGEVKRELAEKGFGGAKAEAALLDLSGSLSLPELAAWLGRLDCYLTNDSGPMHLAWAQGTPVTAVFGPTVRRLGFFPRGEASSVFESDVACRPCGLHGPQRCPKGHHACMRGVLPETVWPDIQRKLFASICI